MVWSNDKVQTLYYRSRLLATHALVVALLLSLVGCAAPEPSPERDSPFHVSAATWWQIDHDIANASLAAEEAAENYARGLMDGWMRRVGELGEEDFIPWYTGYWTQQWLAIKVAWYKMGDGDDDGDEPAVRRLAAYLQEEYQERVLGPAAEEVDPNAVSEQATKLYVKLLAEQLPAIPRRYEVPLAQFDRRLQAIPAISAATPGAQNASLYRLVHSDPIAALPAYASLLAHLRELRAGLGSGPSDARLSPIAERAAERLTDQLAIKSGASAAAAALGGVAGMVFSLGAAGFGAIAHAQEKAALEAQLRDILAVAQEEMWRQLVEDRASGVLAGIQHIAEQIEHGLASARTERWPLGAAMSAPEITGNRPEGDHQLQPLRADFSGGG
ncbi:MAG: hypothetical protein AW10_01515 [Candidatus Accumulibacter appositus]|uniref:Lipoprotein n=1 Tax=Candidatus Accumulibacter appositus TaxID=1454003 RepID=A0A011PV45_9PROT|nr:MAG: hypothetical protein AW10_01515 [Candidatus Accumulibacter appositus]